MKKIITIMILVCSMSFLFSDGRITRKDNAHDYTIYITDNKIIDYNVVEAKNISDLEIQVKNLIKIGWVPFGDLTVSLGSNFYAQVMVKYETTKEK